MKENSTNKSRLLELLNIFSTESDETNTFTLDELTKKLGKRLAPNNRKTYYNDFKSLQEYGYEIAYNRANRGYYLKNKHFDLYDIKLLIDSLYCNTCLPVETYEDMEQKLFFYTNSKNKKFIKDSLYILTKPQEKNKKFRDLYKKIIDSIKNKKIIKVELKNGHTHTYIPLATKISNNRYYLYCMDTENNHLRSPRLDNIVNVEVTKDSYDPVSNEKVKDWLDTFNNGYSNDNTDSVKIKILKNYDETVSLLKADFPSGVLKDDIFTVITSITPHFFGKLLHFEDAITIVSKGYEEYNKAYINYIKAIDKITK